MKLIAMLFMLVCGAVLQAVVPTGALIGEARAPILLGLVVYYSLSRSKGEALRAALMAGFFQDALCMIPLGYSSFVFCCIAWAMNEVREEVFAFQWVTHALFGALSNAVITLFLYILLSQNGSLVMSFMSLTLKMVGAAILGACFVPFIYQGALTLDSRLGLMEAREGL